MNQAVKYWRNIKHNPNYDVIECKVCGRKTCIAVCDECWVKEFD